VAAEIRRLARTDAAAWGVLRLALFHADPPQSVIAEIDELLSDPVQAAFGAFEGTRLDGFGEVSQRPWGEGCTTAPVAWIEAIYVRPERQRDGIGAALTAAMEEWARARGLREVGSGVQPDNSASLAAHLAWGYEETFRLVMFRKQL
jgi:aminoglycoside 6'-N-acetyltransferase I